MSGSDARLCSSAFSAHTPSMSVLLISLKSTEQASPSVSFVSLGFFFPALAVNGKECSSDICSFAVMSSSVVELLALTSQQAGSCYLRHLAIEFLISR